MIKIFLRLSCDVLFIYRSHFFVLFLMLVLTSYGIVNSIEERFNSFSNVRSINIDFLQGDYRSDEAGLNFVLNVNLLSNDELVAVAKSKSFFNYISNDPSFYSFVSSEFFSLNREQAFDLFSMRYFDFYWDEKYSWFVLKSVSSSLEGSNSFNDFIYKKLNAFYKVYFCNSTYFDESKIKMINQSKVLGLYSKSLSVYMNTCQSNIQLLNLVAEPMVDTDLNKPRKLRISLFICFSSLFFLYTFLIVKEINKFE